MANLMGREYDLKAVKHQTIGEVFGEKVQVRDVMRRWWTFLKNNNVPFEQR